MMVEVTLETRASARVGSIVRPPKRGRVRATVIGRTSAALPEPPRVGAFACAVPSGSAERPIMISASNFLPHRGAAQLALGHASTDSTRRYLESAGMPPERSHCVLIAVVPEDFRPETPWEIPPRILSAEVADDHALVQRHADPPWSGGC